MKPQLRRVLALALAAGVTVWILPAPSAAQYLSAQDVLSADPVEADFVLAYGNEPEQFGHLRLPEGSGPFPVLVIIHGGCWLSFANLQYMSRFAADLSEAGIATWNIEYRRVDSPGGGWPNTFLDVANGIDYLRFLQAEYHLDLSQVIVAGHSAGGHLALWAAGRSNISEESPLYLEAPLVIKGAVSLDGPGQLAPMRDTDNEVCGGDVVDMLMGGSPEEVPDNYAAGSPIRLLPIDVPMRLVTGEDDPAVPPRFAEAFAAAAAEVGDDATVIILREAAHFEAIVPETNVWPEVRSTILGMFGKVEQ
jgi:acetyl esterase/lipase